MKVCPICKNSDGTKFELITSQIRNNLEKNVFKCLNCSLVFLDNTRTQKEITSFYRGNYKYKPNYQKSVKINKIQSIMNQKRFVKIKPFLSSKMELLEIGCGNGDFLKMVKPLVKGVSGVELNKDYVDRLRGENITVHDKPIEQLVLNKRYDIVCIFSTLEHVPDLDKFFSSLRNLVHNNSYIFIDVPNIMDALVSYYDMQEFRNFYFRETHLYYFSPKTLATLLKKFGFVAKVNLLQYYSFTNHLNWIYLKRPQENLTVAYSCILPVAYQSDKFKKLTDRFFEQIDRTYRDFLIKNGFSDVIWCEAKLKGKRSM